VVIWGKRGKKYPRFTGKQKRAMRSNVSEKGKKGSNKK